ASPVRTPTVRARRKILRPLRCHQECGVDATRHPTMHRPGLRRPPAVTLLRLCLDCNTPTIEGRCSRCWNQRYGTLHQAERRAWAPRRAAGGVACGWCAQPITIDPTVAGDGWDIGHHADGTRSPWHAHCNRSAAARGEA